jgi:hypothetical protein
MSVYSVMLTYNALTDVPNPGSVQDGHTLQKKGLHVAGWRPANLNAVKRIL